MWLVVEQESKAFSTPWSVDHTQRKRWEGFLVLSSGVSSKVGVGSAYLTFHCASSEGLGENQPAMWLLCFYLAVFWDVGG